MRWWHVRVGMATATAMLLAKMVVNARADPVVRSARVAMPPWPMGADPVRVLVWSDVHLGNLATGRERLMRLVARANELYTDLVLLAGDFIAGHDRRDAGIAPDLQPLAGLRARWRTVAVLGNHDHWTDAAAVRTALRGAGIVVLENGAVHLGPLAIGVLGDAPTRHASPDQTRAAMARVGGVPLLVAHSPEVPGGWRGLVVAGHTHCGQIVLPLVGPPAEVTAADYRCGMVREPGRTTIVTAGTDTSVVPLRLGAPPDWWLLTLGPPIGGRATAQRAPRSSSISRAVALADPTTPGMPAPGWVPAPTK